MCSSSIPLEPEEAAVAVTAAGATPENLDAGPEHNHPQDAEKRRVPPYMGMRDCMVVLRLTPCDRHRPDCLGLSSRGWRQAAKIGQQGEAGVSFSARVPVNNAGGVFGNWARPGSSGERVSRGRSEDVPLSVPVLRPVQVGHTAEWLSRCYGLWICAAVC